MLFSGAERFGFEAQTTGTVEVEVGAPVEVAYRILPINNGRAEFSLCANYVQMHESVSANALANM